MAAEGDGSVSERPGERANAPGQAQREQAGAGRESAPGQAQREQAGAGRESAPGQSEREPGGGDRAPEQAPGEQAGGGGAGGPAPGRPGTGGTGAGRETPSPPSTPSRPSGSSGAGSGGTPRETQGGGSTEGSSTSESPRRETDPAPAPTSSTSTSRSGVSDQTSAGTSDAGGRDGSPREVGGSSASRSQEASSDGPGQAGDAARDEGVAGGRAGDRTDGQGGTSPGGDGSGGASAGSGGASAGIALPERVGRTPAASATSLDAPPVTGDAAGRAAAADGTRVAAGAGPEGAEAPDERTAGDATAGARTASAPEGADGASAGNEPARWNALASLPSLAPPDDARSTAQWLLVSGLLTLLLLTMVLATRRIPVPALGRWGGGGRGAGPTPPTVGRGAEGPDAQRSRFAPGSAGPGGASSVRVRGSAVPPDAGSAGVGVAPPVGARGSSAPRDPGVPAPSVTPSVEPGAAPTSPVTRPVATASEHRRSHPDVATAGRAPASSAAATAPIVRETGDVARVDSDPLLEAMAAIERRRSLTGRIALSTSAELSLESRIASLCLAVMPVGAGLLALALGGRPATGGPAALGAWTALGLAIVLTAVGVRSTGRLHDTRSRLLERFERSLDQRTRWTGQVLATLDRAQMHAAVGVDGVVALRRAAPDDPADPVQRALDEREGVGGGAPTASRFLVELVEELEADRASATVLGRWSEQVHVWHRLALEHRVALVRARAVGPFLAFFAPATALLLVSFSA
jgi:hypothetical protein